MFPTISSLINSSILLQAIGDSAADRIIIGTLFILFLLSAFALYRNSRINKELKRQTELIKKQTLQIEDKNKRLEEKNKSLQALNEEKNNIMGVVSHDLRAPLNRIFALSNLIFLSEDNLNEEQKNYLEKINQVVSESLNMIRNFLDIRAIEYKGIHIGQEEVDLDKLLQQLVRSYKSVTEDKNQQIEYINECKEETPVLESDQQYLNRIFDNLISNATKFSPSNRTIRIVLTLKDEAVVVKVIDNGPGIGPIDQERLFQKFQVLTARPTGGESSTGLGLSITKSLVEMLDGSIWYEDNPEGGSVFAVELPVLTHA